MFYDTFDVQLEDFGQNTNNDWAWIQFFQAAIFA